MSMCPRTARATEACQTGRKCNSFYKLIPLRFDKEDYLFSLQAGQDFGDLALLSETNTRTCTIRAATNDTFLIELSKDHFLEFIGEYKTETVAKTIDLFNSCLLLKGISTRSKKVLASKSFFVKYPANTVILRQTEKPFNIYFVNKGSVNVVRKVNKSDLTPSGNNEMILNKYERIPQHLLLTVETLRNPIRT